MYLEWFLHTVEYLLKFLMYVIDQVHLTFESFNFPKFQVEFLMHLMG